MAGQYDESKHKRHPKGSGDEGGQFASKGEDGLMDLNNLEGAIYDQHVAMGDSVAEAMGYPQDKVFYSPEVPTFELDGKKYNKAGEAYVYDKPNHHKYQKGDIVMYPNALGHELSIGAVVAHEIGHQRFQQALDAGLFKGMDEARQKQLMNDDGVTDYSRRWWNAHTEGKATTEQAFHETFAELTMLKATAPKKYNMTVTSSWHQLFEAVNKKVKPPGAAE